MHARPQHSEGNELPRVWPRHRKVLFRPKRLCESKPNYPDGHVFWLQESRVEKDQAHGRSRGNFSGRGAKKCRVFQLGILSLELTLSQLAYLSRLFVTIDSHQ